jgi:prepilin-type N-terminal cleavage/methylation domain-containing protein
VIGRARALARDDSGFTLIELLVTLVVLGVIMAPLSGVVLAYLKNTDTTSARMSESHDAQIVSSYFGQDVRAIGVRGAYSTTAEPTFVQSIETAAPATGGLYPCGAAGTPNAVVRLAWDEFDDATAGSRTQRRIAYVVEGSELHRIDCAGSSAAVADLTIAHDLVAPFASVSCADAAGAAMSCTGSALPETVSLVLTIQDADSGSTTPYEVTLTGQRRQT